jgi:hypothetical protein
MPRNQELRGCDVSECCLRRHAPPIPDLWPGRRCEPPIEARTKELQPLRAIAATGGCGSLAREFENCALRTRAEWLRGQWDFDLSDARG